MDRIKTKKQFKVLIAVAVAALLIAVIVISVFASGGGTKEYDTHLEMAQKYLDELNYEQAIVELRMAIEIEPNDSEAYMTLSEVYVAMGDYENAQAVLEEGYAATGDAELLAERDRIAAEQQKEQALQVEAFYEKYAGLYDFAWDNVFPDEGFDRYLTFAEREQAYGGLAEQLEQFLVDLGELEGLSENFYDEYVVGWTSNKVGNITYFTKFGAYSYLADTYLCMGRMEECLRVRTEWAAFCDRPDLVQDGNHGYGEWLTIEYDRYGRVTGNYGDDWSSVYTYGEPHGGATHYTFADPEGQWEEDATYDSEGRIISRHQVYTQENEGVTVQDEEYVFTGNHSCVISITVVYPDGHMGQMQQWEQFYDEYGRAESRMEISQ